MKFFKHRNLLFLFTGIFLFAVACEKDDDAGPSGGNGDGNSPGEITLSSQVEGQGTTAVSGAVNKTFSGAAFYNTAVFYNDYTGYEFQIEDSATTDYMNVLIIMQNSGGQVMPEEGTYSVVSDNTPPDGNFATVGFRSNDTLNVYLGTNAATTGTVTVSNLDGLECDIVFEADSLTNDFGGSVGWVDINGAMKAREQ